MAEFIEAETLEEAVETAYRRGWTDGLPVVPPTRRLVEAALEYLGRDPQEVIGEIPPLNRIATVEKVVVNCVMAGCLPQYIPVVLAALEAMLHPRFNLGSVVTTTNTLAPLVIVGGPCVKELGFNYRHNVFGGGSRANATVGRAVRLVLWNIGGAYPGQADFSTLGHPGRYTYCIAEDPEFEGWPPLHAERGYDPHENCVTVIACDAPRRLRSGAGWDFPLEQVLDTMAESMTDPNDDPLLFGTSVRAGEALLVVGPMAAQRFVREGYSKDDLRRALAQRTGRTVEVMRRMTGLRGWPIFWDQAVPSPTPDTFVPMFPDPNQLLITVAGGWGSGSAWCAFCPGWGGSLTWSQTRPIRFP